MCKLSRWDLGLAVAYNHSRRCRRQDCTRCPDRSSLEFDHIRHPLQRRLFSTPSTLGKALSKRYRNRSHRRSTWKNIGSRTYKLRRCSNGKRRFHRTFRRCTRGLDHVRLRSRRMFRPLLGPSWPRYRQNKCPYRRSRSRLHRRNCPRCIALRQHTPFHWPEAFGVDCRLLRRCIRPACIRCRRRVRTRSGHTRHRTLGLFWPRNRRNTSRNRRCCNTRHPRNNSTNTGISRCKARRCIACRPNSRRSHRPSILRQDRGHWRWGRRFR